MAAPVQIAPQMALLLDWKAARGAHYIKFDRQAGVGDGAEHEPHLKGEKDEFRAKDADKEAAQQPVSPLASAQLLLRSVLATARARALAAGRRCHAGAAAAHLPGCAPGGPEPGGLVTCRTSWRCAGVLWLPGQPGCVFRVLPARCKAERGHHVPASGVVEGAIHLFRSCAGAGAWGVLQCWGVQAEPCRARRLSRPIQALNA